jgi:hypothetical protein
VAPLVGEATRTFVESFYENLGKEPAARRILDRLDLAQMESLKLSQGRHLSFLLSPGTTAEELRKRAWHVGEIHALYGVDLSVLLLPRHSMERSLPRPWETLAFPDSNEPVSR